MFRTPRFCVFCGCVMFGLRAILLLAEGAVGAGVALVVVVKGLLKVVVLVMIGLRFTGVPDAILVLLS